MKKKEEKNEGPWIPPPLEDLDVFAVQALSKGIASQAQQERVWEYIVWTLCGTDRLTYWPGGEDGRRATDFAEGKRWVGLQLRKLARLRPDRRSMGLPPGENKA